MLFGSSLLQKGILADYEKAAREMNSPRNMRYKDAFTEVPSTASQETYAWLGSIPTLKEWIGEKTIKSLKDAKYTIVNKDWEGTLSVDRNEVEDDQLKTIRPRIEMLAQAAIKFPHLLISDLLKNGDTGLAYDGTAFFATTRSAFGSNLLTGTGVTIAQLSTDLAAARAAMMGLKDDSGEAMDIVGDTVVCPPALEYAFRQIMQSSTAANQSNPNVVNPWESIINRLIVDPRLADANDWYLLCTTMPLRPFVYQNRKAPLFVALDKPDTPSVFFNKTMYFGVEVRGNAGYGFWQMAVKTTNT